MPRPADRDDRMWFAGCPSAVNKSPAPLVSIPLQRAPALPALRSASPAPQTQLACKNPAGSRPLRLSASSGLPCGVAAPSSGGTAAPSSTRTGSAGMPAPRCAVFRSSHRGGDQTRPPGLVPKRPWSQGIKALRGHPLIPRKTALDSLLSMADGGDPGAPRAANAVLWAVGVIGAAIAVVALVWSVTSLNQLRGTQAWLKAHGSTTEATVLAVRYRGCVSLDVEYRTDAGRTVRADGVEVFRLRKYRPGSQIPLRYDPAHVSHVRSANEQCGDAHGEGRRWIVIVASTLTLLALAAIAARAWIASSRSEPR